ncbi:MAG TPA: DNA repair protein RadA [Candidatus Hydrogenedentes bacterium]|nr:DNA repair protein RadA [Candidatus Hydrogenedentota bacterium]
MTRTKTRFVCEECGAVQAKWSGKCVECESWNTLVEEEMPEEGPHSRASVAVTSAPVPVTDNAQAAPSRVSGGMDEFDRVMGGGIVPGSLALVGGDPGIGKSTLMLQVSHHIATNEGAVLYVSGEESFDQARLRAGRLDTLHDSLLMLTETHVSAIAPHVSQGEYRLVVVDSIQSVYTSRLAAAPGSVSQVRECANEFMRLAKTTRTPIVLVGHVTKEGVIAGPRLLEHLVDTVLYFEGEGRQSLRVLRAVKNRFGSTNEIGVFEMHDTGLCEVKNPSALFLDERPLGVSGSSVFPGMEGARPLLVEVQALVSDAHAGSPRRTITGVNPNRVALLLAVLERHAGLRFCDRDVFVNVAGGIRLDEPAADLAVATALASSLLGKPVTPEAVVFGEVGLSGEIRAVSAARHRAREAAKFGFARCIMPAGCMRDAAITAITPEPVTKIVDAIRIALE